MITIVNYGMGNVASIENMFKRIGFKTSLAADPEAILRADKLLLPGVGAFGAAMHNIKSIVGLREALDQKALVEKVPVLGVCLGMQLLGGSSEESEDAGLGWIPAKSRRIPVASNLKVPHMGWDVVRINKPSLLTAGVEDGSRYYFVHSYFVKVDNPSHSLMTTNYGVEFDAAIGLENIYGVQFHPEKSHKFGMKILKNFAEL